MHARSRWTPAALLILAGSAHALGAGLFPAAIDLSTLNGTDGFVINGIDVYDQSGTSVASAGDVNGDGIDDLIIGAFGADPYAQDGAGASYVVFGGVGVGAGGSIDLSTLNGANGFALNGIAPDDRSGISVSAASDVNGDGIGDLIIGAPGVDVGGAYDAGAAYVVFGRDTASVGGFPAAIDLSTLNGADGFVIAGIEGNSGVSVSSAGDVNADGIDDVIIGADHAAPGGVGNAGESYVVFGRDTASVGNFPAIFDLSTLNGTNGFALSGFEAEGLSGVSVSSAGDVNGDGIDDVIIGGPLVDAGGTYDAGESYVVFGRDTASVGDYPAAIDLSTLDGTNGFALRGIDSDDRSGVSVSGAGDVNGDGVGDLIIGAYQADPYGVSLAGESYIVFGKDTGAVGSFPAVFNLSTLDGTNGFVVTGIGAYDNSGTSVSGAGDVNGDGVDDLIIGAPGASPNAQFYAGQSYVLFGRDTGTVGNFPGALDPSTLDGENGFALNGSALDFSGFSVSAAGDINGDGVGDLVVGAPLATPNAQPYAGSTYVVFGRGCPGDLDGDGDTDVFDFGIFAGNFGASGLTPFTGGDLDGDGDVDVFDFGIFAGGFGCGG